MGKRKSSSSKRLNAKKKPKYAEKLEKVFNCPFCGYVDCVDCSFDKELWVATLRCFYCSESYTTAMTPLTEPIDVFAEWIDECQLVNPDSAANHRRPDLASHSSRPSKIPTKIPKQQLVPPRRRSIQLV